MYYRNCRKWRSGGNSCFFILFVMSLVWCVTPAQADMSAITLEVNVSSTLGTGTYQITLGLTDYDIPTDTWSWTLDSPLVILDIETGLNTIATVEAASFTYVNDPQVNFGFNITAGAADVEVEITSGLLTFATFLDPASAFASAQIDLFDAGGGGATLTGLGPLGAAYLAKYNGLVAGDGATFAELLKTPLNGTSGDTDESPFGGGFASIGVPVFNMSSLFHFQLTANDNVIGLSSFEVIPAPGALSLLAIGLIGSRRRRRIAV